MRQSREVLAMHYKFKKTILFPIWISLFKLLSTILVGYTFWKVISPGNYSVSQHLLDIFTGWDASWYTKIAKSGYVVTQDNSINAFFPIYPLLIRFVHFISHRSYDCSAFVVSTLSMFLTFFVLYDIVKNEQNEAIAKKTLWLYAAFPASMFLSVGYSESTNLLFITLYFYCLQKRYWYPSLVFGALATLTHDLGVLLCFSSLIYWYKDRTTLQTHHRLIRFLSIGIIPLSLFLFMGYLWMTWGSPFEFMHAQAHWNRHIVIPVYSLIQLLIQLPHLGNSNFKFMTLINCLSTLLFFCLLIPLVRDKTISPEQKIFYIITFFVSISSDAGNAAQSYARFMLILFPGFILLAKLIKNETAFTSTLLVFFGTEVILLGMFTNGYLVN